MLPDAPWSLSGELVVALVRRRGAQVALPEGVRPMPGPFVLWAGHWGQTPVGPFTELGIAVPARIGLRPGLCTTLSVVDNGEARLAGRLGWGVPRELGAVRWVALGRRRQVTWAERDVEVRAEARVVRGPFVALLRGVQRRSDGPVIVPFRLLGWIRRADVVVHVPEGDPLEPLAGARRGWLVGGRQLVLQPSRHPSGLLRTLVAPRQAPEVAGG